MRPPAFEMIQSCDLGPDCDILTRVRVRSTKGGRYEGKRLPVFLGVVRLLCAASLPAASSSASPAASFRRRPNTYS